MLAFVSYVTDNEIFQQNASRWLSALPPAEAITGQSTDEPSVAAGYNSVFEAFAAEPSIEAVVLVRQEVTVSDPELLDKIRKALIDDNVAVVGLVGGANVTSMAWWDGDAHGTLADPVQSQDYGRHPQNVDIVDNSFVVVNKWAIQNLKFDDSYGSGFDGIVEDLCMQARRAGKTVMVAGIDASTIDANRYSTIEQYRLAYVKFQDKWSASLATSSPRQSSFLEIGGGTNALAGWLNIDTEHAEGDFLRGAQETPWPIPDNHLRMIWASHVMEHIPAGGDRIAVMNEAWRTMRPGGQLEIRLPGFPGWQAVADPTHVSFWVPQSFLYFTGEIGANADYGISRWETVSIEVNDGWELRGVLRKPLTAL